MARQLELGVQIPVERNLLQTKPFGVGNQGDRVVGCIKRGREKRVNRAQHSKLIA